MEDAEAAMKKLHFYRFSEGPSKWIFQEVSQPPEIGNVSYRQPCTVSVAANNFYTDEQSMSR